MNAVVILSMALAAVMAAPKKAYEIKDPAQMIAEVKGMVCIFCSFTVRENLERLDFLDKKMFRKGKVASVEEGTVTMALARGKKVDFAELYRIMHKGGYDILAVHLNLTGVVSKKDDSIMMLNEFTGQEFSLVDVQWRPWWDAEDYEGSRISVQGVIPEDALAKPEAGRWVPVKVKSVRVLQDEKAGQKAEVSQK